MPSIHGSGEKNEIMKFLQINLNHCRAAQELLHQTVAERNIDIAIISEPYKLIDSNKYVSNTTNSASVWACSSEPFFLDNVSSGAGYARTFFRGIWVYSCYMPPRWSLQEYGNALDELVEDVRTHTPSIVAGDFNAWATEWHSRFTNARGELLLEAFGVLNLILVNEGSKNTYRKGQAASIVDLTFASPQLARSMSWHVSDLYTASDHMAILFNLQEQTHRTHLSSARRFKVKTLNTPISREKLANMSISGNGERMAEMAMEALHQACEASMSKGRRSSRHKSVYWWNPEIAELRTECNRARRIYTRAVRGSASSDGLLHFAITVTLF